METRAMELAERSPAFWKAEAARAQASAETMKNPLAKKGMEHIAECYEGFARRAEKLPRQKTRGAARIATDGHRGVRESRAVEGLEAGGAAVW
jgi:hypothetical protein